MRLLLDTHAFLWLTSAPDRLGGTLPVVADAETELLLSAASAWEIAIKFGLGRLELPEPPRSWVPSRAEDVGAQPIPVSHADAVAVADLPPVHRDPFDRMLVVQSHTREARLLTADRVFQEYDVDCLWLS